VAEELALKERLDDCGAVEDDVLPLDPAASMQSAGDQVFAGPGGSLDESGAIMWRKCGGCGRTSGPCAGWRR